MLNRRANLVSVGEIHPVGILQPGDDLRAVLDLEVSLHDLDVNDLPLFGSGEIGASVTEREVAVVRLNETVNGWKHWRHSGRDSSTREEVRQSGEVPRCADKICWYGGR